MWNSIRNFFHKHRMMILTFTVLGAIIIIYVIVSQMGPPPYP